MTHLPPAAPPVPVPNSGHGFSGPYDRVLTIWPQRFTAAQAAVWAIALYCVFHAGLRLAFSDVIAVDWVAHTLEVQSLDLYQNPKYPPAPAWALWLVTQVTGPGAFSTLFVKYVTLGLAYVAYFFAARRVLRHDGWAVFATLAILALYQLGWNVHEGMSHTLFLILAAPVTLLALLEVQERPRLLAYILFGAAVGLGALGKQSYFAGLAALLTAALLQPGYRRALLDRRIALSVAVALAMALPHYVAVFASGYDFAGAAAGTLARPGLDDWGAQVLAGLTSTVVAPLLFLSPLLPILVLAAPRAFAPGNLAHPGQHGVAGADPVRLIRDMLLAALVILAVPVLVAGVAHYGERWMHPVMLMAPVYFTAVLRAAHVPPARVRALVWVFAGLAVLVAGWRVAGFVYPGENTCGRCRLEVPYADLADRLAQAGFRGGTILAGDEHIAGNLRTHFPDARMVSLTYDYYDPPAAPPDAMGQCLVVWRTLDRAPTAVVPPRALAYAQLSGIPDAARVFTVSLPHGHPFRPDDYAVSRFAAVLMDASGRCR